MAYNRHFWNDANRAELRSMAALGKTASEIGAILGASKPSVMTTAGRAGIKMVLHTQAEIAEMEANRKGRKKRRRDRSQSRRKIVLIEKQTSKTSAIYRKTLPPIPEMTKNELRAMITQAVINTGARA